MTLMSIPIPYEIASRRSSFLAEFLQALLRDRPPSMRALIEARRPDKPSDRVVLVGIHAELAVAGHVHRAKVRAEDFRRQSAARVGLPVINLEARQSATVHHWGLTTGANRHGDAPVDSGPPSPKSGVRL